MSRQRDFRGSVIKNLKAFQLELFGRVLPEEALGGFVVQEIRMLDYPYFPSVRGEGLNPDTPVERVADLLEEVELVLVMSVFPGFGGQSFMPEVLPKVRWVREPQDGSDVQPGMGIRFLSLAEGSNEAISEYVARRDPIPGGRRRASRT